MAEPEDPEPGKLPATLNLARDSIPGPDFLDKLVSNLRPDDVAIEYLQSDNQIQRFSYGWLHSASDALAAQLAPELARRSPRRRNTVIPVLIPQSPTLYICYLAILKLGHAFCPLNLDTPPERLKFIINDVGADTVLCLQELRDDIKCLLPEVSCVVPQQASQTSGNHSRTIASRLESISRQGSDIAYIMYTSGSTGLPKAVVLPHFSVAQALLAHDEHIPSFRKFLQFAAPTFDVSVFEIFFPLFRGASLACCERNHMLADLPFIMRKLDVDIAELTPSVAASLLKRRSAAPNLRHLLTIGEAMNQHTLNEFGGSPARESMLYALYGPTEASIHCAILPKMQISDGLNNIGKPLRTVTAMILAEDGLENTDVLARGMKGELALVGQLAEGYLNRQAETQAAFVHLPGYGQVYRTGDRAVITEDGHIRIYGRIKEGQVKIRGQRVELGEIEASACKTEGVELTVAMMIGSSVVLFCSGYEVKDEDSIRESCSTWLPKHMRPSTVILCREGFPRLPSGKIDRQQLRLRYKGGFSSSSGNLAELTETQRILIERFSAECGYSIELHGSFIENGIDSLKAIVIAATLSDSFPAISMKSILESDSVAKLSERLSELHASSDTEQYCDAQSKSIHRMVKLEDEVRAEVLREHPHCDIEAMRVCSDIQIGMLAETVQRSTANYNTIQISLAENISQQDFDQAFHGIACANEILRSSFVQTSSSSSSSPFAMVVRNRINPMEAPSLWDPLTWRHGQESGVHQVTITIHHAIYDGWSWDLIMHDLNALLKKQPISLRSSYENFRQWKEKRRNQLWKADAAYWESELARWPSSVFPCLCSELPSVMQYESTHLNTDMKLSVLKSFAQSLRISTQAILQASVSLLISSYVESNDLITGFVSSGRDVAIQGIDKLIGPCLSTYPLRINVEEVRTVRDLFMLVNRKQMLSLDHANCSLQRIKQMLKFTPEQQLFDVICAWQESPVEIRQRSHPAHVVSTFDSVLCSMLVEAEPDYGNDSIILKCTSRNDRIPLEHAKVLLKQLSSIMLVATEDPSLTPSNVWERLDRDIISSCDTHPVLTPLDTSPNISDIVREISIAEPERIAVEFFDDGDELPLKKTILSYAELHRRGLHIAARLVTEHQIEPDDIVCICLPKSIDLYVLIYAVIEAGAGYLCIDPNNSAWRINAIITEAKCKLLVLQSEHQFIPGGDVPITRDERLHEKHDYSLTQRGQRASDGHLAYAVSTSGTTGKPKIVLVTRQNLFQNITALSQIYPHQAQDRLLQSCSPAFDVSVFEIFWTWYCGMTLCTASNDVLFRDLTRFISQVGITHLSMTPSVAALVDPDSVPTVKFLVCAGEPMSQVVDTRWRGRGLYQGYGPSETTNICTVRSAAGTRTPINNIGKPLPDTKIFICARRGDRKPAAQQHEFPPLMPLGGRGEIWIGGAQVGRGYTDLTLTDRSWFNHPIHGRLYRSGDVGHLLYDGSILYTGRTDDQIKIRGLRIELKEVALTVMTTPHVDNACCFKLSVHAKEELVCFCTKRLGTSTNGSLVHTIFENIDQRLPDYMLPDLIVPLSEFPMTTQGKIDGAKLANIYRDMSQTERAKYGRFKVDGRHASRMTECESAIAEAVARIVNVPLEQIDATASFFAMGIDSIRAITLTNLLRKGGFAHVEISGVLKHASVSRLAFFLQSKRYTNGVHENDVKLLRHLSQIWTDSLSTRFGQLGHEIEDMLPCTSLQSAMLASTSAINSDKYWNTLVYNINVPMGLIQKAWSVIIRRHAIFRTAFVVGESLDDPYCQVVLRNFELPWRQSQVSTPENGNHLDILSDQPPYEFVLVSANTLQLRIHHAMYDAVALDMVHSEIEALCHQRELFSPVSFKKYLQFIDRMDQRELDSFWSPRLRRKTPCLLMSDALRHDSGRPIQTERTAKVSLRAIEGQAHCSQVTILAVLQAALARLLNVCLDKRQFCFGTVFSGRNIDVDGAENIVGPCFNTLPTPISCSTGLSNRQLFQELHQFNLDVLPYQATSLRLLNRRYCAGKRAFFDCLLLLQPPATKLDASVFSLVSEQGTMDFPFIFEAVPNADKDELKLTLHSQLQSLGLAEDLLSLFDDLIEDCAHYPESSVLSAANTYNNWSDVFLSASSRPHTNGVTCDNDEVESLDQRTLDIGRVVIDIVNDLKHEEPKIANLSSTIFQIGLDSINAIQLVQALRNKGYTISLADVLEHPHLKDITKVCSRTNAINGTKSATFDLDAFDQRWRQYFMQHLELPTVDVETIWPCTPVQSGILSQTIASQYKLYLSTIVLSLYDGVDLIRLRDAWHHCMQRHAILRTGFGHTKDSNFPYAMIVYAQRSSELPWHMVGDQELQLHDVDAWHAAVLDRGTPPWRIIIDNTGGRRNLRLQIHHALYDAKSLQTIFQDAESLYKNISLPAVASVASLLRHALITSDSANHTEELYEVLKDKAQITIFPNLNPNHVLESAMFVERRCLSLSSQIASEGCKTLDCSFLALCQASWAQLLSYYLGQEYVAFGNITSDRAFHDPDMNAVVFPCIRTTPVCVHITPDAGNTLAQLQTINAASTRYRHARQSPLLHKLAADGTLYDTVLVVQHEADEVGTTGFWHVVEEKTSAEFSVSLEVLHRRDAILELRITAQSAMLPLEQAVVLLAQFERIMRNMLRLEHDLKSQLSPDASLLSILPAAEAKIPCAAVTLHDMFLVSAEKYPNSTAFEFATSLSSTGVELRRWTYTQLRKKSFQVANLLVSSGAQTGDLVGLCFDKCPEASFALLGIQAAGCGYVAVDPAAPPTRKDFVLKDAQCKILLATSSSMWTTSDNPGIRIWLLDDDTMLSEMPETAPSLSRPVSSEDTCYCLYTSGTTGQPKGCLISHCSAVQAMKSFQRIFAGRWDENSRWLQFAGFHFDVSVLEHFWSWSVGICVTSVPRDLLFEDLCGTINALQITHLDLTPSLARLISPREVPTLCKGVFIVGGEQVRQDIYDVWASSGCLYNFYGPSEVTIGCTFRKVTPDSKPSNIGQQWDNVDTFVLNPRSEEVVIRGAIGELCLGGGLVGQGYVNRSELTAQKFVTLEASDDRVYRTGDLVRLLHDNSFEFLGRIDDQVKLRGQRLEIGEINHVLIQSHPDVKDVATLVVSHPQQVTEQLIAFVSVVEGKAPTQTQPQVLLDHDWPEMLNAARSTAAQKLPAYMIPAQFVVLDYLPLTLNNKVDGRTLRQIYYDIQTPTLHSPENQQTDRAQDSWLWPKLASTISAYTGITQEAIHPGTSIFELGVDSVSVVGLARVLKQAGLPGINIPALLRSRSLEGLMEILEQSKNDVQDGRNSKQSHRTTAFPSNDKLYTAVIQQLHIAPTAIEAIVPCTPLQEGMVTKVLMDDSMHPPYLVQFDFELEPSIDIKNLANAWKAVATSLGILRTRFVPTEMGIAQVVLHPVNAPAPITRGGDSRKAFKDFVAASRKFDDEPPWQVCFTTKDACKPLSMSLFAFHGIYDAMSLPLLLDVVRDLYLNPTADISKAPQFHNINMHGHSLSDKSEHKFWQNHLGSVKLLGLHEPFQTETATQTVSLKVNLPQISDICASLKVTASAVFHGSWLLTIARAFKCNPTIGVVVSGRMIEIDDADRIIGPLFNTLPRRVSASTTRSTLSDLIILCHDKNVETIPRQHTSLSQIRKWLSLPTNHDLFDSLFVFQKAPEMQSQDSLWTLKSSATIAEYPLNVEIEEKVHHRFQISVSMIKAGYKSVDAGTLLKIYAEILSNLRDSLDSALPSCFAPSDKNHSRLDHSNRPDTKPAEDLELSNSQAAIRRSVADLAGVDWRQVKQNSPTIFELGFDSVDAVKIASRLRSEGLSIAVSKIIKYPTVAGIDQHVVAHKPHVNEAAIGTSTDSNLSDIKQAVLSDDDEIDDSDSVLPVTPMQAGLLLDADKYFHKFLYQILDGVSPERLADALIQVVARTSTLRTRFAALDISHSKEAFEQIIEGSRNASIPQYSIKDETELETYVCTIEESISSAGSRPLIAIVNVDGGPSYLVLGLHHASYDGISLSLLHQTIQRAYFGKTSPVTPLAAIKEYIKAAKAASTHAGSNKFWAPQLRGILPSLIGSIGRDAAAAPACFLQRASRISLTHLRRSCKDHGITIQSVGLACWSLALAHLMQQLDVCFGLVASGRTTIETQELPFPTFNTVIFRPQLRPGIRKADLLGRIHQLASDIYEHQLFPLSQAAAHAGQPASTLFNTLFTFQKRPATNDNLQPIYEEWRSTKEVRQPPYAFNLEMEEVDYKLQWTIAVQQGVMSAEKVASMFDVLDFILDNLTSEGDIDIVQAVFNKTSICGMQAFEAKSTLDNIEADGKETSSTSLYSRAEQSVCKVYAELSGTTIERITRSTTLFNLGLDSISSMKVSKLLRNAGWRVPVSKVLEKQSVAGIASVAEEIHDDGKDITKGAERPALDVDAEKAVRARLRLHKIDDDDIEAVLPTSGGQDYMLDMWRASHGRLFYSTFWFDIRNCDEKRLEQALKQLVNEIPALRTQFVKYGGRYYQIVLRTESLSQQIVPLSYQTKSKSDKVLLRVQIHHALYDGVSLETIIQRLTRSCAGEQAQNKTTMTTDQRAFLRATIALVPEEKQQQKDFWTTYIGTGHSGKPMTGSFAASRTEVFVSNMTFVEPILGKVKQEGISFQAAFFTVAARQWAKTAQVHDNEPSENRNVWIGIYVSNRTLDIADLSQLACPTFNIVPLRVELDGDILTASRRVQQDLIEVSKAIHCGVSLREIYEWTGLQLDCYINFLRLPDDKAEADSEVGETVEIRHAQAEAKSMVQEFGPCEKVSPLIEEADSEGLEWCLPAMDVEARVDETGRLGVGVFVPSDMLDGDGVGRYIEGLRTTLEEIGV